MSTPSARAAQYAWLLAYLRPRIGPIAAVLALAVATTAIGVLTPWITKHIIDDGLIGRNAQALIGWVVLMLGLTVAAALLGALNRRAYLAVSSDMLLAMRHDMFAHLARLSPAFFGRTTQGNLLSRIDGDLGEVQRYALDSLLAGVNGMLALIAALVMMALLSPGLMLVAFVLLPVSVVFLRLARPRLESQTRALRERSTDITSLLMDRLPNMRMLQSLLAVGPTITLLDDTQRVWRTQLLSTQMFGYWVATVPGLFNTLATAAVFIVGGHAVIEGDLTLGTLIAFTGYLGRASGPVNSLLGLYVATQRARVSLARVHELLDAKALVTEPQQPVVLPPGPGEIRLEQMQYAHDGGPALWQPVSLCLPGGARVWIDGPSGAGKSTMLALLQRHADPGHGRILLDSIALDQLAFHALRSAITLLDQDAPMLDASVRENLGLGMQVPDTAMLEALNQAMLGAWFATLPDGLDTRIGHRAARLSGGERHRLALARVLLRRPRVLLFDETTAAMDGPLAESIWASVATLFPVQTLIVAAHRRPSLALSHRLALAQGVWTLEAL